MLLLASNTNNTRVIFSTFFVCEKTEKAQKTNMMQNKRIKQKYLYIINEIKLKKILINERGVEITAPL